MEDQNRIDAADKQKTSRTKKTSRRPELEKRFKKEIAPFTLSDLPLSENEEEDLFVTKYLYQKVLGAGSFGVVIAAVDRAHLEECAIKVLFLFDYPFQQIISKDLAGSEVTEELNLEAEVLAKLDHPNIVRFLKVTLQLAPKIQLHESPYHYFIVMERIKGGSLADFVLYRRKIEQPLSEGECRVIMKQILEGLNYIHSNNILHRDLKPANILMKSFHNIANAIKIADFGLCTQLDYDSDMSPTERCGTRCYMAPEQIQGKSYWKVIHEIIQYKQGIDIWAAGIIMYILLAGKHPFYQRKEKTTKYLTKMINPTWSHNIKCTEQIVGFLPRQRLAKALMYKLCSPNVLNRYSAVEALKHPWITGYIIRCLFIPKRRNMSASQPLTCLEVYMNKRLSALLRSVFFISLCGNGKSAANRQIEDSPYTALGKSTHSNSPARQKEFCKRPPRGYSLNLKQCAYISKHNVVALPNRRLPQHLKVTCPSPSMYFLHYSINRNQKGQRQHTKMCPSTEKVPASKKRPNNDLLEYNYKTYADGIIISPINAKKMYSTAANSAANTPERGKHARFISWESAGKAHQGVKRKYTTCIEGSPPKAFDGKYHMSTFYCPKKDEVELPPIEGKGKFDGTGSPIKVKVNAKKGKKGWL
eukprot:TRINITY_DN88881_c1_g1_i1.p1 TRINITY_DN88881_c1_g1~~TRINITY_DN88881_c1_g1_i1.p1  ORF type:complete len:673 (+),score=32.44 TRINITY_DN88881_c1_g1_i1:88-2019(+)